MSLPDLSAGEAGESGSPVRMNQARACFQGFLTKSWKPCLMVGLILAIGLSTPVGLLAVLRSAAAINRECQDPSPEDTDPFEDATPEGEGESAEIVSALIRLRSGSIPRCTRYFLWPWTMLTTTMGRPSRRLTAQATSSPQAGPSGIGSSRSSPESVPLLPSLADPATLSFHPVSAHARSRPPTSAPCAPRTVTFTSRNTRMTE